ncbi:MAG: glycosyltransferase family 39 protein [Gemmatimonadaceae bacterium]|nr:glycosyltransferase family 39 protein [Gemmatimonadaceae bacterium]
MPIRSDLTRGTRPLLWAVLGVGVVFRLISFLDRRSLWYDEAMLSVNVLTRSWSGLLQPLDYEQAAPVPFLWAQKVLVQIAGVNEYSLRFLSLVAGLLVVLMVWRLTREVFAETEALVATALVSLSPMLIRYSNEAKPYEVDALVAVLLVLAAIWVVEDPAPVRRWIVLTCAGVGGLILSIPALFVVAAVGAGLVCAPKVRAVPGWLGRITAVGSAWVATFALQYVFIYQYSAANHPLILYAWEFNFLRPNAPDILERLSFAVTATMSGFLLGTLDEGRWGPVIMAGVTIHTLAAVVLSLLGLVTIARQRGVWLVVMLAGGVVAAAGASAVEKYPISVRLMLFVAPFVLMALSLGIVQAAAWLSARHRRAAVVLLAAAFVGPAFARGVLTSIAPIRRQDAREVVEELQRRRTGRDAVYIYPHAVPSWAFYSPDWSAPEFGRLRWLADIARAGGPAFPANPSRERAVVNEGQNLVYSHGDWLELIGVPTGRVERWGYGGGKAPDDGWAENEATRMRSAGNRVWLFFVPINPGDREPNLSQLQAALERRRGVKRFEFHRREADLYLYEFPSVP